METTSATSAEAAPPRHTQSPRLKHNAISYVSNVVIGVASTAPGYSLAATVGFMVAVGGVTVHNPAVVIVSFIPMLFIAMAYKAMNAVDPDCGTTFSWLTRSMGPQIGFVIGWLIIVSDIVVNANQAQIAGSYGFQLVGLNGAAASTADVIILGGIFIILLTWICWKGIELSARTQQLLLGFELTTLTVFAVVALIKAYASPAAGSGMHSMHVTLDWFNPFALSAGSLISGMLLGVFLYWGWDTGVSVNEESHNSSDGPGRSAITSTLVLIGIYLLVSVASQAYAGTGYLSNSNNSGDIFAGGLARGVLGSLHFLLTIAVLTSATAATQTTIIPAARSALSMARRGALPATFAEIHDKNLSPSSATIWAGILSLIWFVAISLLSSNVLSDCVSGLGILVCIYYGFTGFGAAWFYRHELRKSARNLWTIGILPVIGGLVLMLILVKAVITYGHQANNYSKDLLGLGVPDWIAILGVATGVILMLVRMATAPGFFQREKKRLVYGDPIEVVTPEAEFAPAETML